MYAYAQMPKGLAAVRLATAFQLEVPPSLRKRKQTVWTSIDFVRVFVALAIVLPTADITDFPCGSFSQRDLTATRAGKLRLKHIVVSGKPPGFPDCSGGP